MSGLACEHCGYSLAGHAVEAGITCPECGRHATGRPPRRVDLPPLRWALLPVIVTWGGTILVSRFWSPSELSGVGVLIFTWIVMMVVLPVLIGLAWAAYSPRAPHGAEARVGAAFTYAMVCWAIHGAILPVILAILFLVQALGR